MESDCGSSETDSNTNSSEFENDDSATTSFSKAIKELVSFHSSYLAEQGFSQMINIKNKKRNKLEWDAL